VQKLQYESSKRRSQRSEFFVNVPPVTYPQDNNFTAFKVEDNSIISNSESISSEFSVSKCFRISMRILLMNREPGRP